MKTAIIYYSKHGTTERVAHLIGEKLSPELEYISLKEFHNPDIQGYDRIILGTSIYAGHPGRLMSKFCNKNRAQLEQKIIALFICGMNDTQEVEQLKKAFPEYLHSNAVAETILGGEFLFDKMNFIEKFITRKISKVVCSVSNLRYDAITVFLDKMNNIRKRYMMKVSNNKRNILIFRTSITTKLEIERIKILFAQYSQIHKWNLDFEDWEKVLRIESHGITETDVINILQAINIYISELE